MWSLSISIVSSSSVVSLGDSPGEDDGRVGVVVVDVVEEGA